MSGSPYPKLKNSGVDWLGDVPEHWTLCRLKWSAISARNGIWGDEANGDENDIVCVRVADFDRTSLTVRLAEPTLRSVTEKERVGRQLQRGNLLMEKSGGGEGQPVGAVVLYDHDETAVCSNFVARVELAPGMVPSYWRYLHAAAYSIRLTTRSINQTSGIQNLDQTRYFNEVVAVPPTQEQTAIAAFLDRETGKIDALVEEQKRLIALLKEKRQAVISHGVTKGLDPNAPMQPSGVEWLGDVPEHWAVGHLKHFIQILSGYAFPSGLFSQDETDTRLLRGVNIAVGSIRWEDVVYWQRTPGDSLASFELRDGDVVLGMDRPWIGEGLRIAQLKRSDIPALLLQRVAALRPSASMLSGHLVRLLQGGAFFHHCFPKMTGVSVPHISPNQVGTFVVPVPPLNEQRQIEAFLNAETQKVDDLLRTTEVAIKLLQERRSALISAAVTGKIDVKELDQNEGEAA